MAKRTIREKELTSTLQKEGFKEIKKVEKLAKWYKKASERPPCLKTVQSDKIKSR